MSETDEKSQSQTGPDTVSTNSKLRELQKRSFASPTETVEDVEELKELISKRQKKLGIKWEGRMSLEASDGFNDCEIESVDLARDRSSGRQNIA